MIKVLMLGWEFPPQFSGGLGVATFGIVKALSKQAHINLILPTAGDITLPNVDILGINSVKQKQEFSEHVYHSLRQYTQSIRHVPLTISPYHHINQQLGADHFLNLDGVELPEEIAIKIKKIFSGGDSYGYDIMHKVYIYSILANEIAATLNFDIIHAHDWVTFPAALAIQQSTRKSLVLHVHALETDRSGSEARNEIYNMEYEAMQAATEVAAVSEYTKSQIIRHYHIDPSKVSVIHNGIDDDKKVKGISTIPQKKVVFLGRLTHQKGPTFLLETIEKVSKVYPHVKFIIAGTGDQFTALLELSAYKRLSQYILFTGFLSTDKVQSLLSIADVYFMPSVSEPFGLTALEASQHKIPCVLSSQSGAAEVLPSTLQASFWDTTQYANYIYALLKYNALGKFLAEASCEKVKQLTWDENASALMSLYSRLLSKTSLN